MPAFFKPALEVLVGARRMRGARPFARMAVKVGQELMPELFELDQHVVRGGHVGHDAQPAAALVRELGPLVEHMNALDLGAGDEKKLLVRIRRQLLGAFMQEERTDGIAPRPVLSPVFSSMIRSRLSRNSFVRRISVARCAVPLRARTASP